MKRWPQIPLGFRLFFLFFVLVGITAYMVNKTVIDELKPTIRQVTEETLVDMANLLAILAEDDVANKQLSESHFAKILSVYGKRNPHADIWDVDKNSVTHRIYITDEKGIVIADSWQQAVGEDYSQWNDVYLTLRGEYGARSTSEDINDPLSTVMFVAAPIYHDDHIIGSVTIAKSNRSIQPFIDLSTRNVIFWLLWMSGLVLIAGGLFSWRTHSALNKLEHYATKMGLGEKVSKPTFRIFYEYGALSDALEKMRGQLDGKQYVEEYVQTLTHELKSPLSAIKGASEILQTTLPAEKTARFAKNVERESERMQSLIDKLLALASLEKRPQLEALAPINLNALVVEVMQASDARLTAKSVVHEIKGEQVTLLGDGFLLKQALFNIMDNALDFVENNGVIEWEITTLKEQVQVTLYNSGPVIPDYAMPRLTERFYSLARENGIKSTGLGLNFVEQITKLHHGSLALENVKKGVKVTLTLQTT